MAELLEVQDSLGKLATVVGEQAVTIDRVFKLGDYKSLRVQVRDVSLPDEVRESLMYENAFDAYLQLFIHQRVNCFLMDSDPGEWDERICRLKELRAEFRAEEI